MTFVSAVCAQGGQPPSSRIHRLHWSICGHMDRGNPIEAGQHGGGSLVRVTGARLISRAVADPAPSRSRCLHLCSHLDLCCHRDWKRPPCPLGQTGLAIERGGVDRAPWLDPPPKRAQLTGPPKSYRD